MTPFQRTKLTFTAQVIVPSVGLGLVVIPLKSPVDLRVVFPGLLRL